MTCGIYKLEAPSRNFYIGSSVKIEGRINDHFRNLRDGKHCNKALLRAHVKYGELIGSVILACEEKNLLFYEQLIFDGWKPVYNNSSIAGKVEFTKEVRRKMSVSLKGRVAPNKGKRASEETKLKLSLAKMGNVPWNKGMIYPRELGERLAKSRIGIRYSEETKRKQSEARKGVPKSEEHRCNAAKARKAVGNKPWTKERRERLKANWEKRFKRKRKQP